MTKKRALDRCPMALVERGSVLGSTSEFIAACVLREGHAGVCKGGDGKALTVSELHPELRARFVTRDVR